LGNQYTKWQKYLHITALSEKLNDNIINTINQNSVINLDGEDVNNYCFVPGLGYILIENDKKQTEAHLNNVFSSLNYLSVFQSNSNVKFKVPKEDNIYIEVNLNEIERGINQKYKDSIESDFDINQSISSLFGGKGFDIYQTLKINAEEIFNRNKRLIPQENKEKKIYKNYENIHSSKTCNNLDYTFGVEIETILGRIYPEEFIEKEILCSVTKDGSLRDPDGTIRGGEYVTPVLKGDTGFYKLYQLVSMLSERCKIDGRCGIHVHVGNVKFNKYFNVAAYILAKQLENEIFSLMLPSRRNNDMCGKLFDKRVHEFKSILKNANDIDSGVDMCYHKFYKELSLSNELGKGANKFSQHPGGRYTFRYQRNIDIKQLDRYKWLNFIACNFNMRDKHVSKRELDGSNGLNNFLTLEFRLHHASLNFEEIRNWVLICFAFVNYIEKNQNKIFLNSEDITLKELILFSYSGHMARMLLEHINSSQTQFNESFNEPLYYKNSKTTVNFDSLKSYIHYVSDNLQE